MVGHLQGGPPILRMEWREGRKGGMFKQGIGKAYLDLYVNMAFVLNLVNILMLFLWALSNISFLDMHHFLILSSHV